MVQVLAFVMMMLAMAVFVLSQSVSKRAVEAIAAAVNADVKPNSDMKQLTQAVMEKLDSLRGSTSADPAKQEKMPAPATPNPSDASHADEQKIAGMRVSAPRVQPRTAPIEPKPNAPRLTVEFDGKSFTIDEERARSVSRFVNENGVADRSKAIVVNAYAYTGEGAISEARRLAYYRAMMARKQLVDAKVRPENIRINVNDIADRTKAQTIEMIVTDPSAN
jgi:hypothetical protein